MHLVTALPNEFREYVNIYNRKGHRAAIRHLNTMRVKGRVWEAMLNYCDDHHGSKHARALLAYMGI